MAVSQQTIFQGKRILTVHGTGNTPSVPPIPEVEALFQTEDGPKFEAGGRTSKRSTVMGDIVVTTDGQTQFTVTGSNRVIQGSRREAPKIRGVFPLN